MKLKDITEAYCRRNGLSLLEGRLGENDAAPLLPFLLMDCAYQEFVKEIKPIDMHHKAKKAKTDWLSEYRSFNHRLFSCLNAEQSDFAIEKMDEYGEYVSNDVFRIKIAVMNLVGGCTLDEQKTIGSLMLVNILSQVAQITWGLVYKTPARQEERCPELIRMRTLSHFLSNCIADLPEDVHPNDDERLNKEVDVFMMKTTKWLKN